ncbi:MAG TPA: hypothetical protein PLI51_07585 [bacterium]|nr:hypothetical protein [bacterium]
MGKLFARFAVLLCAAALCVAVLEGAAGALFPAAPGFFIWPPFLEETFFPDQKIMPGTSAQAWFRTNSLGLRSYEPAPNDDYRVLVLGGSAAECLYLTQRDTWPRRMVTLLHQARPGIRTWVGNGGRSGQTTRDHIFHVEYLPLKEMDIDAISSWRGSTTCSCVCAAESITTRIICATPIRPRPRSTTLF